MLRRLLFVIALALASTPAFAQIRTIGGSSGGGATVSDSLKALANGTAAAPSLAFLNSTGTGLYRFGADTFGIATGGVHSLRISGGANPTLTGGAGSLTIIAGTGGSRSLLLQATDGPGNPCTAQTLRVTATVFGGGCAAVDSLLFTSGTSVIRGGAGNMTIQAGTGASRTLTLQTTNSGSSTQNNLVLNANGSSNFLARVKNSSAGTAALPVWTFNQDSTAGMYFGNADTLGFASKGVAFARGMSDTLIVSSKAKAGSLTAAAGTPNSVCMNATTKEIVENAATSCVVSSARYKQNIVPLSPVVADRIVSQLRPSTFKYRAGGRTAVGLIAEQVATVDTRFVTNDASGRPNAVNYEQVTVALLAVVQQQQAQIDSLLGRPNRRPVRTGSTTSHEAGLALLLGGGLVAAAFSRRRAA